MAAISMHKAVVKVDVASSSTVTTDISAGITKVSIDGPTRQVGGHHTLSSDWQNQTVGGLDVGITISTRVDKTAGQAFIVLYDWLEEGTARTFQIYTPDTVTGSLLFSGEAVVASCDTPVNAEAGSGNPQIATFKLRVDGALTQATA